MTAGGRSASHGKQFAYIAAPRLPRNRDSNGAGLPTTTLPCLQGTLLHRMSGAGNHALGSALGGRLQTALPLGSYADQAACGHD